MYAIIIQEQEPEIVYTGRIWFKPSIAKAFIRLGASWIPLGVGDISDVMIDFQSVTVLIDGVDKTLLVEKESISITDAITHEEDSCSFVINDISGTNKPIVGQEVQVYYKPNVGSPILIFGGKIVDMPQGKISVGEYQYEINCIDYSQELMRNLVVKTYKEKTAGFIIKDIVNTYALNLGTYYVEDGIQVEYIAFNSKFPRECIEELCDLTGYDYYVDYEKYVHFFDASVNAAPYSLTDSALDSIYRDLSISIDKSSLVNKQVVRGGYQFSELFEEEQVADGTQDAYNLKYEPYTPVKVYVDTGGGYAEKTLGIDNIDPDGTDFVVNVTEKNIKNSDYATLTAGHKIKISYKYKMPVLAQVEDKASIQAMRELEGGDGIYEGELIVDETLETIGAAKQRALAELRQYANPIIEGSFSTNQYGYKSGQILTVNIPSRGIDSQYVIQEVTSTSLGNGLFEYEITFATKLKGLTEFLKYLFDNGKKVFERTDELLSVIKTLDDGFIVKDSALSSTLRDIVVNPYVWSLDDGSTANKGQWQKATWGA